MAFVDLSQGVPVEARWIRVRFSMRSKNAGEPLVAKLWSGNPAAGVILSGQSGDAIVRLEIPQMLSYERAPGVELSLKVIAFKTSD